MIWVEGKSAKEESGFESGVFLFRFSPHSQFSWSLRSSITQKQKTSLSCRFVASAGSQEKVSFSLRAFRCMRRRLARAAAQTLEAVLLLHKPPTTTTMVLPCSSAVTKAWTLSSTAGAASSSFSSCLGGISRAGAFERRGFEIGNAVHVAGEKRAHQIDRTNARLFYHLFCARVEPCLLSVSACLDL